jgi:hypothetical protein
MGVFVVREWEKGTLEALIVSPIRRWELLLGKIIPNLVVAYGQMTMTLLVAHYVFDVPVRGSLTLLYVLAAAFMLGTLGIGIFLSAVSRTVPQAMQLTFLTFLPSIYLSGLLFPIEGMPTAAQYLSAIIPLTYFLRIVRGIVLKGVGFGYLWPSLVPLLIFGIVIFSLDASKFRKTWTGETLHATSRIHDASGGGPGHPGCAALSLIARCCQRNGPARGRAPRHPHRGGAGLSACGLRLRSAGCGRACEPHRRYADRGTAKRSGPEIDQAIEFVGKPREGDAGGTAPLSLSVLKRT